MSTKIVQTSFGGPEVLELVDQTPPAAAELAADEVLVRVAFAGVNPIDVMTRTGGAMAAAGLITLPFTPGWDLAGTVEAVGSQVETLKVGDRVYGMARFPHPGAAYARYAIVPAVDLAPTPETVADAAAAALPLAAMTAWQAFADTTKVTPGQRVLITGAGGGVGHFAVQIADHLGATVTAVAGAAKHDWLRGLGADRTVDYADPGALAALIAEPVNVALVLVGGDIGHRALAAVRPGGVLISLVGASDELRAAADDADVRLATTSVRTERAWLDQITHLAATKALVPQRSPRSTSPTPPRPTDSSKPATSKAKSFCGHEAAATGDEDAAVAVDPLPRAGYPGRKLSLPPRRRPLQCCKGPTAQPTIQGVHLMRGAVMYGPGDVRVEDRPEPGISRRPTRSSGCPRPASAGRTCGRTAASKRSRAPHGPRVRRHRRGGRRRGPTIRPGQFVVGSFFASDNTCAICRAGYQSSCVHRGVGERRPGRVPACPARRRHPRRHPGRPARRSDPEPAGRLRRPRAPAGSVRSPPRPARARPSRSSATARSVSSAYWRPSNSGPSGSSP